MRNRTHHPEARSWLTSANGHPDFPIQNLPFASARPAGEAHFRGMVAIGDRALDLAALASSAVLQGLAQEAAQAGAQPKLNALMALGPAAWSALREALFDLLSSTAPATQQAEVQRCLHPQSTLTFGLPAHVGDYTDFYTSIHHATNVGRLFRPDNPLLPNYTWVPIGYHGRTSSLVVSGTDVHRPQGQTLPAGATEPRFGPSQRLDWEVEMGVLMGPGNALGQPIPLTQAEDHVFGLCLLNDWSARDIQAWEYQPLGPFLSKNFATTLSPWVVTLEALAPYRCALERLDGKQQDLPYLHLEANRAQGALDVQLDIAVQTPAMREAGLPHQVVATTSYRHAYWTLAQMVTHHTVGGCNLQPGDLLGTGTLSGPEPHQAGALLELTQGGKQPITLPQGETRVFLQDGDDVILRGWCEAPGAARIGLGECRGRILPAPALL